jgi:hypothetical protein
VCCVNIHKKNYHNKNIPVPLFYFFHNIKNIDCCFIIGDTIIQVRLLEHNDKCNCIIFRERKKYMVTRKDIKNIVLEKILKNLLMVDVFTICFSIHDSFYVNVPITTKKIYLCPVGTNRTNRTDIKIPFDCVIHYKPLCCVYSALNY